MRRHGGFEHNSQSLRIVEELEQKYPGFHGLNLTWETREGLVKHYTAYDHPSRRRGFDAKHSALEAQVANLADEITYYNHDLDDGLDTGLLDERKLAREVTLWGRAARRIRKEHGELADECRRYFIIRCLIDEQVKDVVTTTEQHIRDAGVNSADEVRLHAKPLVQYSATRRNLNAELREYLYANLYFNPVVHEPNIRAVRLMEDLFRYFLEHPQQLGTQSRQRLRKAGKQRAICDYLAGMTDRYLVIEHERLVGAKG